MTQEMIQFPYYNVIAVTVASESQKSRMGWKSIFQIHFYPASSLSRVDKELANQLKQINALFDTSFPTTVILAHIAALSKTHIRTFVEDERLGERETLESHSFVLNGKPAAVTTLIDSKKYPYVESAVVVDAVEQKQECAQS